MQAIAAEAGAEHGEDNTAAQPFYRLLIPPCHTSAGLLFLYEHRLTAAAYAPRQWFFCHQNSVLMNQTTRRQPVRPSNTPRR